MSFQDPGARKSSKWQSLDLEGNNNGLSRPAPERVTFVATKPGQIVAKAIALEENRNSFNIF